MRTYFLSDLHLGAIYFPDRIEAERNVVSFLDSIKDDADEIYLVGDILDYWYEYKYVVPRGFVRFFGKLAELCDRGIKITWLIGNHDIWIFDYLPSELGIQVVDGILEKEIKGKRFFITHGDGVGELKPSFRFIRSLFRNHVCQRLFSGIHPRWTVPFALKWSRSSRDADKGYADETGLNKLTAFSKEYYDRFPDINYFVFGHIHVMADEKISDSCRMIVLGDWITRFSYGVFDGNSFKILKWSAK